MSELKTVLDSRDLAGNPLRLLVIWQDAIATFPLPGSGNVVLGRDREVELHVDFPPVSRQHARLHLGPTIEIEDLGSSNGTRINGRALVPSQRVPLEIGQLIELGSATAIVQRAPAVSDRAVRVRSHAYFEDRLSEECTGALEEGRSVAVLRVRFAGPAVPELLVTRLTALGIRHPLIAAYGPAELEALLLNLTASEARELARQLDVKLSTAGHPARIGVAVLGEDGRDGEALLSAAYSSVRAPSLTEDTGIVVLDPRMVQLHQLLARIARGTVSVLLTGETGVGKEVFAAEVHRLSSRAAGPFMKLNCAAISETLLEGELFGYERGAFTGAVRAKTGLLEAGNGGTVFLDEIGELPLGLQAKLLRVLETREVLRLGDLKPRPLDVRFVAATNRDLEAEANQGRFRRDLFYRLNGVSLEIPSLRERPGEIEALAQRFLARACLPEPAKMLSAATLVELRRYSWPGNARELRNMMERASLLAVGEVVEPEHLPLEKMRAVQLLAAPSTAVPARTPPKPSAALGAAPSAERERILAALQTSGGNQKQAAELLGMSRNTLLKKLDQHGLPRPRKPVSGG